MICQLCQSDEPLLKKSHIIPDFMYKSLFDDKHRLAYFNIDKLSEKPKIVFTGIYDANILCSDCDRRRIGQFESYVSKILYTDKISGKDALQYRYLEPEKGLQSILIENIDYKKFKLFLLSILWRSHISKQPFFDQIHLGKFSEGIRKMILDENPGEEDEIETCVFFIKSNKVPSNSVMPPRYIKGEGNSSYVYLINNLVFHFNLSKHNKLDIFDTGKIRKDNTMMIGVITDNVATFYFDSLSKTKLRYK